MGGKLNLVFKTPGVGSCGVKNFCNRLHRVVYTEAGGVRVRWRVVRKPCLPRGLHVVYPTGQPRYYLLLTAIHRFLAPLFTSIRILFETSTSFTANDSTKTWNSARLA